MASCIASTSRHVLGGVRGHTLRTSIRSLATMPPSDSESTSTPQLSPFELERRKKQMRRVVMDTMDDLGSTQSRKTAYRPHKGRLHPKTARELTVSHLLAATAHLGSSKSTMTRASAAFAYGTRHGQVIIDVERHTLPALKLAAKVVGNIVYNDGVVVFVGTDKGMERTILAAAERLGHNGFHVTKERWVPGVLSNAPKILSRAVLGDMETYEEETRALEQSHRRRQDQESPVESAKLASDTLQPDLLIVANPKENLYAIREATQQGIPTIGIIDSDVDPRLVTYAIPANDDSMRAVDLIIGVLSKAGQAAVRDRETAQQTLKRAAHKT